MAQIMTKDEFNKFIDNIYYHKVMGNPRYDYCRNGNVVTVFNRYNNKSGIARCDESDTFQIEYGVALAYCRLKGIEFPKVKTVQQVRVDSLKNGDIFEYSGIEYIFLAKHPTLHTMCYIITPSSNNARTIRSSSVVSVERVE